MDYSVLGPWLVLDIVIIEDRGRDIISHTSTNPRDSKPCPKQAVKYSGAQKITILSQYEGNLSQEYPRMRMSRNRSPKVQMTEETVYGSAMTILRNGRDANHFQLSVPAALIVTPSDIGSGALIRPSFPERCEGDGGK